MQSEALETPLVISPLVRRAAKRRRRLLFVVPALLVVVVAAVLLLRPRSSSVAYATTPVERRTLVRRIELTGRLEVKERVELPAPGAGTLVSIAARLGDRVQEGSTLAVLDARAATIAARAAEASARAAASKVREAEAALTAATEARERTERSAERELASAAELEAAVAREAQARAALSAARAQHAEAREGARSARLSEAQAAIVAPISGVVLRAPETLGAFVSPEREPLFVLGSELASLRIDAEVAESEVGALRADQSAHFTVPAHPGRKFEARVTLVGVDALPSSAAVRYPVELVAQNPDGLLLPGMTATVSVAVARAENVLAVRDAALRFTPEGQEGAPPRTRVWLVRDGELAEMRVVPGLSDGAHTEIRPEPAGSLPLGSPLAIGYAVDERESKANGPGIRLGNR